MPTRPLQLSSTAAASLCSAQLSLLCFVCLAQDYNHESFVWGLYSSNRASLASASYPVILQYLPRSIFGAAYFNCSRMSSYYPSHIAAFGLPASVGPAGDLGLKYLAGFLSLNLIAHYEYTQDERLLRDTLYPWLRLQMNWYEWLLVKQPLPDGQYRYVDPDDCNLEVCSSSKGPISALNGAEPLAIIRRVMTATVAFAQQLGVDHSSLPLWAGHAAALERLPHCSGALRRREHHRVRLQ